MYAHLVDVKVLEFSLESWIVSRLVINKQLFQQLGDSWVHALTFVNFFDDWTFVEGNI